MTTERELRRAVVKLNERAWGAAGALVAGLGLFFATNILVLRGGENVGAHLGLLRNYFPGYRVTFFGSLIGFVYAFVLGYVIGRMIGWMYNRMVAGFPEHQSGRRAI
jgi:hypothetical protein